MDAPDGLKAIPIGRIVLALPKFSLGLLQGLAEALEEYGDGQSEPILRFVAADPATPTTDGYDAASCRKARKRRK